MELTKEVIRVVISERADYRLSGADDQSSFQKQPQYLDAAVKESEIFLSNGLSIAIHVLLGYADCEAKHPLHCKALCQVEVWTVHIQSNGCDEQLGKPSMLPMFLKQAIRSQLFFSSLKSWFAEANSQIENFPRRFRCLYKISTSSHFRAEKENIGSVEEHKFPPCKIDARTTLNIHVKWLKKSHFPVQLLGCPKGAEDDQFVYPLGDKPKVPKEPLQTRKSVSRESSVDVRRKNTQVLDASSNLTKAELNVVTLQKLPLNPLADSSGNIKQKNSSYRLLSDLNGLHSLVKPNTVREVQNDVTSQDCSPNQSPCTKKLKELGKEGSIVNSELFTLNYTPKGRRVLRENNNRRKVAEDVGVSKLRTSFHSSPVPFSRRQLLAERDKPKLRSLPNNFTSKDIYNNNTQTIRTSRRTGLLCNFEESMLKGRISPIRSVEGFKLQLAVLGGSFSVPHVEAETTVHYFNEEAPSLFMSCCNISKFTNANKTGLQIPKCCTVQAVLFNPQGSVVKLFLVHVDVNDIPPQSQTFIRQRTVSISSSPFLDEESRKESAQNGNQEILLNKSSSSKTTNSNTGRNETDNCVSERLQSITGSSASMSTTNVNQCDDNLYLTSQSPKTNSNSVNNENDSQNENNNAKTSSSLKFLIHLRIASDHRNRVFLHGDIKMLLSNKGGDLEGLVFSQTRSTTQMPQCPKYSPTKI